VALYCSVSSFQKTKRARKESFGYCLFGDSSDLDSSTSGDKGYRSHLVRYITMLYLVCDLSCAQRCLMLCFFFFRSSSLANFAIVAGSYGFAFLVDSEDDEDDESDSSQPPWLKFIYKSLDFGSGRERGVRN
jgi:hypothetical protein